MFGQVVIPPVTLSVSCPSFSVSKFCLSMSMSSVHSLHMSTNVLVALFLFGCLGGFTNSVCSIFCVTWLALLLGLLFYDWWIWDLELCCMCAIYTKGDHEAQTNLHKSLRKTVPHHALPGDRTPGSELWPPSGWYLLNRWSFCSQPWYCGALSWGGVCVLQKVWIVILKVTVTVRVEILKKDLFCIFETAELFASNIGTYVGVSSTGLSVMQKWERLDCYLQGQQVTLGLNPHHIFLKVLTTEILFLK